MKQQLVIFCLLVANCLASPTIIPNHGEDIKVELKTDAQILNELKNAEIIIDDEKINLKGQLNNEQSAKIGLLGAILQGFTTAAPASAGGVNYVFYSPLGALIQKLTATTTTTAATTTTPTTTTTLTTTTPITTTPTTTAPTTTAPTTTPSTTMSG